MKEPVVSKLLRYVLYFGFVICLVVTVTLPFMLNNYAKLFFDEFFYEDFYKTYITIFLMIFGALSLWLIAELIFIMRTVPKGPFVRRNVAALRRVGTLALVIGALFFLKCVSFITFLTLVCGVVFVVCALIIYTLCALFAQAVRYKEENELTI